jgi:hypothetical protein
MDVPPFGVARRDRIIEPLNIRSIPMTESKGSSDKAIGRPREWREGRYQQAGRPVDQSVKPSPETAEKPPDIISTPVTRKDYEQPKRPARRGGAPSA